MNLNFALPTALYVEVVVFVRKKQDQQAAVVDVVRKPSVKKDQTQKHTGVLMSPDLHLIHTIIGRRATSYTSSAVERNAVVQ